MIYLLSSIYGLVLGSFANVCIWRLPRDESVRFPVSHCPNCNNRLSWRDNIPVLSFLTLRGRCRFCRRPISYQYPLVEICMAALFVLSAWRFEGDLTQILIFDLVAFYLLTISVIDYHHKIIPDELSLSLLVIGVLLSYWNPYLQFHRLHPILESALSAVVGGGMMLLLAWGGEKLFKKEALGGGDIKLAAGFGAILGWTGLMTALVLGSFLGALLGGGLLLLKRKKMGETIPYGPFLCAGAFLYSLAPAYWGEILFPTLK